MKSQKIASSDMRQAVTLSYLLIEPEYFQGQQDPQARVYSNNVQTSVVLITVQARNINGEVVTLPDDLNTNVIPYTAASGNWDSTMTPSPAGIQPFPEQYAATFPTSTAHPQNYQQFRRYIRYQNVPEGTVNQFAAQVKIGNVTFTTNNRDVQYGGAGQNGRFNSSFRLRSVKPLQYTLSNGGLVVTAPIEVSSAPIEGFTVKVHNRYISLRHPGTSSSVSFYAGSSTAAGSSLHDNKATALGNPGSAVAQKNIPNNNQLGRALNQALTPLLQTRGDSLIVAVAMYARVSELFAPRQTSYYTNGVDVYGNSLEFFITLMSQYPQRGPYDYSMDIDSATV